MKRPEQTLQIAVAHYLSLALPDDVWWTSINPIPGKTKAAAGLSKAMGMRAGAPDLIFLDRGRFFGIELKAGKGSVSDNQLECAEDIRNAGGYIHLCRSLPEVQGVLMAHGIKLKGKLT